MGLAMAKFHRVAEHPTDHRHHPIVLCTRVPHGSIVRGSPMDRNGSRFLIESDESNELPVPKGTNVAIGFHLVDGGLLVSLWLLGLLNEGEEQPKADADHYREGDTRDEDLHLDIVRVKPCEDDADRGPEDVSDHLEQPGGRGRTEKL